MLRDITLGQYYPKDSVIHRLDPRVKITAVLVYIVMLFLVRDFTGYGVSLLAVIAVTAASGVPFRFILRGMRPIAVIILLTFILNLFLYPGTILLSLGPLHITEQGLHQALFMVCRLVLLIFGTALLTYTTKPMKLTDGMESLMSPLSRFGFPSHEIAIIMSIALRFIPMLVQEADKIMKAQQARGADFESGNLIQRAKSMIPILVPLFVSAFRRANDLAMAMEARCYHGGEGRTKMKPLKYHGRDCAAYLATILYVVIIFVVGRFVPFKLWIF